MDAVDHGPGLDGLVVARLDVVYQTDWIASIYPCHVRGLSHLYGNLLLDCGQCWYVLLSVFSANIHYRYAP